MASGNQQWHLRQQHCWWGRLPPGDGQPCWRQRCWSRGHTILHQSCRLVTIFLCMVNFGLLHKVVPLGFTILFLAISYGNSLLPASLFSFNTHVTDSQHLLYSPFYSRSAVIMCFPCFWDETILCSPFQEIQTVQSQFPVAIDGTKKVWWPCWVRTS